jgi:hypothetical protein
VTAHPSQENVRKIRIRLAWSTLDLVYQQILLQVNAIVASTDINLIQGGATTTSSLHFNCLQSQVGLSTNKQFG